ncbi:uncharacterized protein LACBIDRAFT_309731 [Laccaria bicolor S238N-H82]|uniref:Predicted protein n=1 Tax=Laccaria bicolor (strain S238N-H82 / ATCC MYA-4686) TaxID=486041 RepID=B0DSY4_LACBS|nr:uncharacterized protein LACBIDRAFT_309731 [Laccaria bicolor S238N-H82]EDR02397.1 predicted protein [Laccaria bicolor S238N-H82]|eukprot:XP_001887074.1 predicted protein [Laccaria bicolor S238N-H82]
MAAAQSFGYAMAPLQARGMLFIHLRTQNRMVISEFAKLHGLYLNFCFKKQFTNIRAALGG